MYLAYLAIVLPYAFLQAGFASTTARRRGPSSPRSFRPAVDVVITCYAEDPSLLAECCASVAEQDYSGPLRIFVVDDGSPNAKDIQRALWAVQERHPERDWTFLFSSRHINKRASQDKAFRLCKGEIMVTVDSDTVLRPDAVTHMVEEFRDPRVGGVCGNLRPKNGAQNRLTGLLERRYQHQSEQERAAQSRFGAVLCCAGPLSAYRRSVLEPIWERYQTQSFLGRRCITGDDIHLTMLVLRQGFRTTFAWGAHGYTQVPASLGHFCRQQLRWQRSMYRELAWMLPMLPRWHPYIALDVTARMLLPFLLLALGALLAAEAVLIDPAYLGQDGYLVAVPTLVYSALVVWQVGDLKFLAYGPLHILLAVLRLYAVVSLASSNWLTPRGRR
jgi:N-acetylglucosaminyltransferase